MQKSFSILIIILLAMLNSTQAQQTNPEFNAFLERIDGASLEELEQELDEGIKGLQGFMGFFQAPRDEPKSFTSEEERYTEPFKIDVSIAEIAAKQYENIGFLQIFKEHKSYLKFQKIGDDYWSKMSLPEGMEEWFTPKKIYFKDGTSTTEGIGSNKISFFWEEEWGKDIKVIDSVEIDYTIRYTKAYDSLTLTKKTKKLNYKDGIVKVKKLEKNYLYLTVNDAYADKFYLRALSGHGQPLNESSSSFSPTSNNKSGDNMAAILSLLEEVQGKLKNDKFKDVEEFKKYIKKKFSKLEATKDKDGVRHLKFYFDGNIDSVQLYFETEEGSKTVPFTATNNGSFRKILLMQTKDHIIFMDELGNEIFSIDGRPLERIGDRLFVENQTYFYLNTTKKSLDSIEAVKVFETSNGLVFSQKKLENGFLVHDSDLKQLSEIEFSNVWNVGKEYAHTLGLDKENYAIDSKGHIKKIEGVSEIGEFSDGLLIAKTGEKYGFIDPSGEIVIPLIYSDVEAFKEGLAVVKNEEGVLGFINTSGEIVLPLRYYRANSFNNGIALVSDGNGYQLIDTRGKVLVNANTNGYSTSGTGLQKTYLFGDKKYDAFGKLIK